MARSPCLHQLLFSRYLIYLLYFQLLTDIPTQRPLLNPFAINLLRTLFVVTEGVPPSVPRKEQEMTLEASKTSSIKHPRCRHFTADGTRCRLPILDSRSHLCFRHSSLSAAVAQTPQNDSEDLSPDLLPELSEFDSAVDINKFLAKLLVLVTKGRISPRRASVLAYITNQLLHSHRSIILENKAIADQPQEIIFDMPRPERDWPDAEPRPE